MIIMAVRSGFIAAAYNGDLYRSKRTPPTWLGVGGALWSCFG
jgi:hypothetical protein